MPIVRRDESQINLAECHKKLDSINKKIHEIKLKHKAMNNLCPTKSERKMRDDLQDSSLLKKEITIIERDVAFINSLLQGGTGATSSLASKFMKKVLPEKMFGSLCRETSKELKACIMSHSTKFLEDKVMSLESLTKRPKKKKIKDKKALSEGTDYHINFKSEGSSSSLKSGIKDKRENPALKDLVNDPELSNLNSERVHYMNNDIFSDCSVFTLDVLSKKKEKRKQQKVRQKDKDPKLEKFVQTDDMDFVHKKTGNECFEKSIQTDAIQQPFVVPEVFEAFKRIFEEFVPYEKSALTNDVHCQYFSWNDLFDSSKDVNQSAEQPLEIFNLMKEVNLPSVWKCCLENKNDVFVNMLLTNSIDSVGLSDLSETFEMISKFPLSTPYFSGGGSFHEALCLDNLVRLRSVKGQRLRQSFSYILPAIYYINERVMSTAEHFFNSDSVLSGNLPICTSSASFGVSVHVIKNKSQNQSQRNTLQIDYCNSIHKKNGRIVLTESGSEHSSTQSDILARIITYLLGLTPSSDKT